MKRKVARRLQRRADAETRRLVGRAILPGQPGVARFTYSVDGGKTFSELVDVQAFDAATGLKMTFGDDKGR